MARPKKVDDVKKFDVSRPSTRKPSASSRPIIVTNRPIMEDPMMRGKTDTKKPASVKRTAVLPAKSTEKKDANAPSKIEVTEEGKSLDELAAKAGSKKEASTKVEPASTVALPEPETLVDDEDPVESEPIKLAVRQKPKIEPLSEDLKPPKLQVVASTAPATKNEEPTSEESTETSEDDDTIDLNDDSSSASPLVDEPEEPKQSTDALQDDDDTSEAPAPDVETKTEDTDTAVEPEEKEESEPEPKSGSESASEDPDTPQDLVPSDNSKESSDEKPSDSDDGAVDALAGQAAQAKEKRQAEKQDEAYNAKIDKLIESKQYVVPIGHLRRRRHARNFVVALFVVALLAVAVLNFALDAEVINIEIPYLPVTDVMQS